MAFIYESENFVVEAADKPHVSRAEGGHVRILPKIRVSDRTKLSPTLAVELARLTSLVGEAMEIAMNKQGVDVGRINYQDMGNWTVNDPEGPYLHVHIYGRARSAIRQPWGESLYLPQRSSGFYDSFEPLRSDDIREIYSEIVRLLKADKYQAEMWKLV